MIPLNQIKVICNINISDQYMLTLHQEDLGKEVFKEFSLLCIKGEAGTINFVTWDSRSGQAIQEARHFFMPCAWAALWAGPLAVVPEQGMVMV